MEKLSPYLKHKSFLFGFCIVLSFCLLALFAPLLTVNSPELVFEGQSLYPPFWSSLNQGAFFLGTDDLGRDLWSRLAYGARVSIMVGLIVVSLALVVGLILGVSAAYYGGFIDRFVLRLVDLLMSIPSILLAIVVVSLFEPSLWVGILAVSLISLPGFIRVSRSVVLMEKNKEYVQAAKSMGASDKRIILKNILPNSLAPLIVQATLGFSDGILNVAALGFLGLGAQPPTPEWGAMLADARSYIETAPYLVTLPGVFLLFVVVGFNLLGDGLRDIWDPKV